MTTRPPTDVSLRRRLAEACHVLAAEGQGDDVFGHAVVRGSRPDTFWMKPAGLGLEEVGSYDMLLVDLEGRVLRGRRPRHGEVFIHTEILRARPEVGAVVHTHPPHATIFAALGVPLRPITHEGAVFVPPDVPRFDETSDLIVTPERGRAVAAALGDRPALLLVAHGIVTVGATIEDATIGAILLERAARAQLMVPAAAPGHWSRDEDALAKRARLTSPPVVADRWAYYLRRLGRR
jgi:ribulose-5-phosphate 4-epimerase/fuculose-1-phosphate aldolase